jgi:hypothetical protein
MLGINRNRRREVLKMEDLKVIELEETEEIVASDWVAT